MTKKTSVLLCTSHSYPNFSGDGNSALNLAIKLKERKLSPSILTLNFNEKNSTKNIYKEIRIFKESFQNQSLIQKIITRVKLFPKIVKYIYENDIIIIYGKFISYKSIIIISRILGKKVIFRSTSTSFDDIETLTKKKFHNKFILNLISGYFSINPIFTKHYENTFRNKTKVFESCQGVNIERFSPVDETQKKQLRKKLNLPAHDRIIITTGNLYKRKGFDEIFEQLSQLNIDFLYIIVGNHKTNKKHFLYKRQKEINQLFEKGNRLLNEKIQFINPVENIEEYLQSSDVFLFNSKQEGVPNSLLEAMSCGLPVICREIPETHNYITFNENNSLTYSDINSMNTLIKKVFDDKEISEKISKNSRSFICENCNINLVADKFIQKFIPSAKN